MMIKKWDYDPSDLKDIKTWTTAPNMKAGSQIKKSINQAMRYGGVKSVKNKSTNKSIGKEITTKKGNKTWIEEYAKIADQDKNKKKRKA